MLNATPCQLRWEKIKKYQLESEEGGADAGFMNSPDRGYANEGLERWSGEDRIPEGFGGEMGRKKPNCFFQNQHIE